MRYRSIALLLLALPLFSSAAHADEAQNRATARSLAEEGKQALDHHDFATAEDRFSRADALVHAPTLLLFLARARVGLGKLVAAAESYRKVAREGAPAGSPDQFVKAVDDAKLELAQIEPRIAWITIVITPSVSATVTIDAVAVPAAAIGARWAIDPGAHVVHVAADGFAPGDARFSIAEAGAQRIGIDLRVAPGASGRPSASQKLHPGSTQRTVGAVALGIGAVGLGFGAVTGAIALSKHGTLATECPNDTCLPAQHDALGSFRTMTTLSTVGFIAGGVAAAAGIVLLVTAPSSKTESRPAAAFEVSPFIGASGVGAFGRF